MLGKLTKIDELTRSDHFYLDSTDDCYFFGEYTARKNAQFSPCNQLIRNFKHERRWAANPQSGPWRYKQQAISQVAKAIAQRTNASALRAMTFVPVPPSKAKTDPEYDSRCIDTLNKISSFAGHAVDVRELVTQTTSMRKAHNSDDRPGPDELVGAYQINEALAAPTPSSIVIFDDLLTTGSHYKAMQRVLRSRFPAVTIAGIFIARRVPEIDFGFVDES